MELPARESDRAAVRRRLRLDARRAGAPQRQHRPRPRGGRRRARPDRVLLGRRHPHRRRRGAWACASRPTPPRWRATGATPRRSRSRSRRADEQLERLRLTGEAGGPVERAELASGEAEHDRARRRRRSGAVGSRGRDAWASSARPYRRLYARWRQAEALVRRRRPRRRGGGRLDGAARRARAGQRLARRRAGVAGGAGAAAAARPAQGPAAATATGPAQPPKSRSA